MAYRQKIKFLYASIFLAGLSIATDLPSIPISTGVAGFWPGTLMSIIVWVYMAACGILYLEAILVNPDGANVVSICRNLIGGFGIAIGATSFLIINFTFMGAYFSLGSPLLSQILQETLNIFPSNVAVMLLLGFFFAFFIFLGVSTASRLNFLFFSGLIFSFLLMLWHGRNGISLFKLRHYEWFFLPFTIPVLFRAFDYQTILPTLSTFLHRDGIKLRRMILVGTAVLLLFYILWQGFVIGIFSEGGLWIAYEREEPYSQIFSFFRMHAYLNNVFHFLILFAISTSILGCGVAFVDFFGDWFGIPVGERSGWIRALLCLTFLLPSFFIGFYYNELFTQLYAPFSFWFEIIFNGILPIWLVWSARYYLKLPGSQLLPGGKTALILLAAATFLLIFLQGVEIIRKVEI